MQFFLTVHGRKDINPYDSDEDMQDAFRRVGEFNQMLQDTGRWVTAGGLVTPDHAATVLPDGSIVAGPYRDSDTFPSGFWLIDASTEDEALDLTREAAAACANAVELRAVAG